MKYIVIVICVQYCLGQQIITLRGNHEVEMFRDNEYNESFIVSGHILSCISNDLYSYVQTHQEFLQNQAYFIEIDGITEPINIQVGTNFEFINPELNTTTCQSTNCIVSVKNGCPQPSYFNYFDVIQLTIGSLDTFSYNVICDESERINSFEWGIIVEIIISILVIALTATCSNAWSLKNFGISITYWLILGVDVFVIAGASLIFLGLLLDVVDIILTVFTWIYGIATIILCCSEGLYLLKNDFLRKHIDLCCKGYKIRVMDGIGLGVGIGICCGWWFTDKNWILSDLITICIWVGTIKLFKFTSFKMGVFTFCFTIVIELMFIIIMQVILDLSYNSQIINTFNNPYFLQLPTLNPVPNQKCSWLFISSLVYPGILLSYIYRFDKCRSSYVYFTIFVVGYSVGSVIWTLISVFSPFTLPFGIISQPILLIIIILYANRRNELPILWSGQFLDEEYKDNKQKVSQLIEVIKLQKSHSKITFSQSLIRGLRLNTDLTQLRNKE